MQVTAPAASAAATSAGAILLDGVSFAYGSRPIFEHFSCRFEPSATTALVGPSGSGKSTLLALVMGQLSPSSGRVHLPDALLSGGEVDRGNVAWVMQTANVFTRRSASDNVALPLRCRGRSRAESRARAVDALEVVGLRDRADDRCGLLSGGERQRVAVARALAVRAPLVVADEPTVSLDHANRDRLVAALVGVARTGAIVVVATHDPAVWSACDAVVRL